MEGGSEGERVRSPRCVEPAAELALVVAPPCPDLPGRGDGEGVVVSGCDRGDGRREGGHGRGDVHVRGRSRLAHRSVAVVAEPVHRPGARRMGRPARGERGEEPAAEAGSGGAPRAEEVKHLGSRRREETTMAAWFMI
jgi:hypothetical protein